MSTGAGNSLEPCRGEQEPVELGLGSGQFRKHPQSLLLVEEEWRHTHGCVHSSPHPIGLVRHQVGLDVGQEGAEGSPFREGK